MFFPNSSCASQSGRMLAAASLGRCRERRDTLATVKKSAIEPCWSGDVLTPGQTASHPGRPQNTCDNVRCSLTSPSRRIGAHGLVRASEIIHRLWPFPAAVVTFPLDWNAPSPGWATSSVLDAVTAWLIRQFGSEQATKGSAWLQGPAPPGPRLLQR